jgi:integrase
MILTKIIISVSYYGQVKGLKMTATQLTTTRTAIDPIASIQSNERLGDATKAKYTRVMGDFLATGADPLDAGALADFANGLSNSRKAHLKAGIRLYTDCLRDLMNAQADPTAADPVELEARMSQADRRYNALQKAIQVKQAKGEKAHTWLSQKQVRAMYQVTNGGIAGERDRVALGLMVAAGLRREEVVNLTFDDIKLQPVEGRMRTVLNVKGKGAKDRVVPIKDALANEMDTWGARVGHTGFVIRSLGRNREPGESISAVALFQLVRKYGKLIGVPDLAAHDLRRTYAQLGYQAGVPITQISKLLGHANVATTQRYLNLDLDLHTTASDFIPWG